MCKLIFSKYYNRHFLRHLKIDLEDQSKKCFDNNLQKLINTIDKSENKLIELKRNNYETI